MGKITGLVFPVDEAPSNRIPCPHCDKTYASQESLDKHVREKHPDKAPE